ncbi:vesicle-associated membrane protein 5 [Xyrichtys novacula]|uniref:Vesicle-associated membrane protein 5 n=1 Tax=Xyrichtys novacula TaxID=13765 RepID=A0AAV1G5I7_XYRNO|nr:vesicle-associated membrane protein 5 [Xyrichtys novacula]
MENGKNRLQQAQEDVEEVKGIMLDNLNKADERAGKLDDLEDRADELLAKSKAFEKTANQVKQKKRWENKKMKVLVKTHYNSPQSSSEPPSILQYVSVESQAAVFDQ